MNPFLIYFEQFIQKIKDDYFLGMYCLHCFVLLIGAMTSQVNCSKDICHETYRICSAKNIEMIEEICKNNDGIDEFAFPDLRFGNFFAY